MLCHFNQNMKVISQGVIIFAMAVVQSSNLYEGPYHQYIFIFSFSLFLFFNAFSTFIDHSSKMILKFSPT